MKNPVAKALRTPKFKPKKVESKKNIAENQKLMVIIMMAMKMNLQFYTRNNGTISERLRIQSGGGISFNGDTAAANALDDYETGTFTAGFTGTTDTTTGYYTKVGRLVHFAVYGTGLNVTSATSARLTGLPFTCVDKYNAVPFTHGTYTSNCSGGYVNQGSNTVQLIQNNSTNAAVSSVGTRHGMIAGVYMA